jgi:hypothetical protein
MRRNGWTKTAELQQRRDDADGMIHWHPDLLTPSF